MGFFTFSKPETQEEQPQTQPQTQPQPQMQPQTQSRQWESREDNGGADEVFSVPVKAGKRIYYFDVKATRAEDYFITITESRKKPTRDGGFVIDKHKIHLYKEDFAKFAEGFEQVIAFVREHKPDFFEQTQWPAGASNQNNDGQAL